MGAAPREQAKKKTGTINPTANGQAVGLSGESFVIASDNNVRHLRQGFGTIPAQSVINLFAVSFPYLFPVMVSR